MKKNYVICLGVKAWLTPKFYVLFLAFLSLIILKSNLVRAQNPTVEINPLTFIDDESVNLTETFEFVFDKPITGFIQSEVVLSSGLAISNFTAQSLTWNPLSQNTDLASSFNTKVRSYSKDGSFYVESDNNTLIKYDRASGAVLATLQFSLDVSETIVDIDFSDTEIYFVTGEPVAGENNNYLIYVTNFDLTTVIRQSFYNGISKIGVDPDGNICYARHNPASSLLNLNEFHTTDLFYLESDFSFATNIIGSSSIGGDKRVITPSLFYEVNYTPKDIIATGVEKWAIAMDRTDVRYLSNTTIDIVNRGVVVHRSENSPLIPASTTDFALNTDDARLAYDEANGILYLLCFIEANGFNTNYLLLTSIT
ncbi:MAG: hypothetical protein AAFQ94_10420 [Bacteroidota bacterium]